MIKTLRKIKELPIDVGNLQVQVPFENMLIQAPEKKQPVVLPAYQEELTSIKRIQTAIKVL